MGFVIQSNIAALNAQRTLNISSDAMNKSLQRLSSGYRINSAADDAAGLAISQQFSADIASYKVGSQNVSQANALLQIAGGAMDQIDNMLTRLKELATQAASANAGSNLAKINSEGNSLIDEIDRIANSTKYAGTALINGTFSAGNTSVTWNAISNIYDLNVSNAAAGAYTAAYSATSNQLTITKGGVSEMKVLADGAQTVNFSTQGISFDTTAAFVADTAGAAIAGVGITVVAGGAANFQVGTSNSANDRIGITLANVTSGVGGLGLSKDQMLSAANAQTFLGTVDSAISTLSTAQGTVGAAQNRLGYANANLATTIQNFTAAQSTIRDVDMASEMTNFTKNQILVQAGTAMLAQANMAPQQVLSLFK